MKIGIITLSGYVNLGNRLQNYALQEVLKSLGSSVQTIVVAKKEVEEKISLEVKLKGVIKDILFNKSDNQLLENKKKRFKKFTEEYIRESNYIISSKNLSAETLSRFDYFIVGSDQVWNPEYNGVSPIYFLQFAPKHKRISYSASFGISDIPNEYYNKYQLWISEIPYLSVREQAGNKIIESLTGRNASVHVDPTLLLSKDEWLGIQKEPNINIQSEYLLTYFLGGIPDKYKNKINDIALTNNLQIINLGDKSNTEAFLLDPSEFIYLVNNAKLFCTDSFHGCVFSIIMKTPFITFERVTTGASMYSRIETLLDMFDMRNREADGFNDDIFSMDFSGTHEVLEREYEKSINYLKEALRIEE